MRTVDEIAREIASTEATLRRLHKEKRAAIKNRAVPIVAAFDAGANTADISEEYGLSYSTVQGILYRAGRTHTGRMLMRARLGLEGPAQVRT